MKDGAIHLSLTHHGHISDGVQQPHIIVILLVKVRMVVDLQCPVVLPQRLMCNVYSACHHRPVSHLQHVISAEE